MWVVTVDGLHVAIFFQVCVFVLHIRHILHFFSKFAYFLHLYILHIIAASNSEPEPEARRKLTVITLGSSRVTQAEWGARKGPASAPSCLQSNP